MVLGQQLQESGDMLHFFLGAAIRLDLLPVVRFIAKRKARLRMDHGEDSQENLTSSCLRLRYIITLADSALPSSFYSCRKER